jgi:hypothetical protein
MIEVDPARHNKKERPNGRLGARRDRGVRLIKFYETALGDSRAEATLISGLIVPLKTGGRAIGMF